jgi:hypothetical protein
MAGDSHDEVGDGVCEKGATEKVGDEVVPARGGLCFGLFHGFKDT